ncbi:MAG: MFS transporter [Deltaproteobacteria bacterium]|nr:MFS transporter [Deltaproteobacteria bacterium]
MPHPTETHGASQGSMIFMLAAVQFVNILNFMIVMPLGPDFAEHLNIPLSHLGIIGGSYTLAAGVGGVMASVFLDKLGRRQALLLSLGGMTIGTGLGGLAQGYPDMILSRVAAGLFAGPSMAVVMAILSDVVVPEKRGRAMGVVMSAFSLASILGVPAGLELAHRWGWQAAFWGMGLLGLILVTAVWRVLPPMREHLAHPHPGSFLSGYTSMLANPNILTMLLMTVVVMGGQFMLIANLAAYIQVNLGYPREGLGMLYLVGGVVSFFATRLAGPLVDRNGGFTVAAGATVILALVFWGGFIHQPVLIPVLVIYVGFMLGSSFRMVAFSTLSSRLPKPQERGRFMSLQTAVQNFSAALGAMASSLLLSEGPGGVLVGMDWMAYISLGMALLFLPGMAWVEKQVNQEMPLASRLPQASET